MNLKYKIIIGIILFVLSYGVYIKFLGCCTELSTDISKQGYCKLEHGSDYRYNMNTNICSGSSSNSEKYEFDIEDFEKVCERPNFFSSHFYNQCFYASN